MALSGGPAFLAGALSVVAARILFEVAATWVLGHRRPLL